MGISASGGQVAVEVRESAIAATSGLRDDALRGLQAEFKQLPPKYFYDERGSLLFERITELEEYYPTRAERSILELHSEEIAAAAGFPAALIELGSGTASKTRRLLDALADSGELTTYVPVDISPEITRETAERIAAEYPGTDVLGVVCDFEYDLEPLPVGGPRMIAFLGGTIGNFEPVQRRAFLDRIAALLDADDTLLLGTDLVKDTAMLEAAYNDAEGVTAEFNKNVLHVLNRELGADFDLDAFEHVAFFDADNERIDIRLRSLADQLVTVAELGIEVRFADGEEMRTELSCKFTPQSLERAFAGAGLEPVQMWTDPDGLFALTLARRCG